MNNKPQTLKIKGMHCPSCEILINEALVEKGASKVKVDWKKGQVTYSDLDEKTARDIIKKEGYQAI